MEEWKEYRIGDIAKTNTSQYSLSENWETIQYLDTGSITKNQISGIEEFFGNTGLPSRARRKVKHGDIVYSCVRPNLCHYGYIDNPPANLLVSTGFAVITVDPNLADARYIYYFLTQNNIVQSLHTIGEQAVSTYPSIKVSDIEDLSISLPSLPIQHKIADILKSLDDKIEVNRQINDNFYYAFLEVMLIWLMTSLENDNLEQQIQTLFKSWFVDFEPFKDGGFEESDFGMIPQGWNIMAFREFVEPSREKAPVDCLPEYSVTNNGIIPRDAKFNKKLSKSTSMNKVLRKDNLVFGMSREILNWGIMEDEIGGVSPAYNIYVLNRQMVNPIYLKLYMSAKISDFNSLIGTAAREGQGLDKGQLMQKQIYIPTETALQDFFKIYLPIVSAKQKLEAQVNTLVSLRDTLLPQLLSGGLVINNSIV